MFFCISVLLCSGADQKKSFFYYSASTTVSFEPFVPNVLMTFKDANGNVVPGVNATFNWISFDEVDNSTGTAVAGMLLTF